MLAVAHRAGNTIAGLRAALDAGVDLVEADIHLYRGALEVRHSRALGPRLYWDRTTGMTWRRDVAEPELEEVLAVAGGDPRLMLDLKGPSLGVAGRVAETLRERRPGVPVVVCTKQWRMLDAFAGDANVRRILSAASPRQLSRLRARLRRERAHGVSIRLRLLTPEIVAELRGSTDLIMAWPVDTEPALDRSVELGVTGVISQNMALLGRVARG
jgi:glycerophosphoryl diester phosphodiesterase